MECKCCGNSFGLDKRRKMKSGKDKELVKQCPICLSYVNTQFVDNVLQSQLRFHEDWWAEETVDQLLKERDGLTGLAEFIIEKSGGAEKSVLEVGFGRGCLLSALQIAGVKVTGLEPSNELYRKAVAAFDFSPEVGLNSEISDFLESHGKCSYDSVVLWHVLEHLESP